MDITILYSFQIKPINISLQHAVQGRRGGCKQPGIVVYPAKPIKTSYLIYYILIIYTC